MTFDWTHSSAIATAAFFASLVEFIEALTVVLAVGSVRGWRAALIGAAAGLAALIVIVAALGPALRQAPLQLLQLGVGTLLLLFGMRWLRKAILRSAGIIPLHDEAALFVRESESLREHRPAAKYWDAIGTATSFKIVMLEGIEVVFIVIAVSAGGPQLLLPAVAGAGLALILVIGLGVVLHRPVARIPENTLKFVVGILLSAFGTFWVGEGIGAVWPGSDLALLALVIGYLVVALGAIRLARGIARTERGKITA